MSGRSGTSLTLLQRIRNGDSASWARVIEIYDPLVRSWIARGGISRSDVDDLAQEIWGVAASSLGNFRRDREGDTFRGWLRSIARHKVLDHWRSRGRELKSAEGGSDAHRRLHQVTAEEEDLLSSLDEDDPAEVSALFQRALEHVRGEFESRTWQAFWRTAVDGLSARESAAELGTSANAVRMAKSRVLRRLREELGELTPEQ